MTLTAPEAYYWEWSKDLAWGYFDHPPMIAFVIRLFTMLGGDSAFYIRLGALVLSVLTTIVLYLLARDMFGKRQALVVCSVIQIVPFFAAGSIVSVPDAPLAFFWICTVYFVSRATLFNQKRLWYAAGVSLGLALMSKYHSSLLVPCVLVYLVLSKDMRVWLLRKEPYLAVLVGLLVFLPNLLWNIEHHATTFRFLLVERHGEVEFSIKGVLIFVAGFLVMLSPLFAVVAVRFIPRIGRAAFREYDDRYLLLLSTSLPPIIFFGLLSPFMHIGAHWVAVGYTTLCLAVISLLMEKQPSGKISLFNGFPLISIIFSLVFVVGAHLFVAIAASIPPNVKFAGGTYNLLISEKQEEFYGWEELSVKLQEIAKSMPDPERTFFISHGYRFASHLRFLVGAKFQTRTTGFNEWKNQYAVWNDLDSLKGWDAVFVEKDRSNKDPELLMKIFERVGPFEELEIRVNHFKVRSFYIIRCFGYKARYIFP
jgi:4-amino-4-deoxy-L-arabinose transferase-like glycosyltransferase